MVEHVHDVWRPGLEAKSDFVLKSLELLAGRPRFVQHFKRKILVIGCLDLKDDTGSTAPHLTNDSVHVKSCLENSGLLLFISLRDRVGIYLIILRASKLDGMRPGRELCGRWLGLPSPFDRSPRQQDCPKPNASKIDPSRPIKSWRTAWRRALKDAGLSIRFHDLRHACITKLAESQASEQTIMSIAGHLSRTMLEHYSHIRMAAKRVALEGIVKNQTTGADFQTGVNQNVHQLANAESGAPAN